MENKSLKSLKKKAIELGIKEPGVGWSTCCPPKGRKADIIKAIKKKEKVVTLFTLNVNKNAYLTKLSL